MTRSEHLFTILAEECCEVAHRVSKALRFGPEEIQPGQPHTNAQRVLLEFADMQAVVNMLRDEGIIPKFATTGHDLTAFLDAKTEKVEKFLEFSAARGLVDGEAAVPDYPHPEAINAGD
jgi:hypothetical protein